MGELPLNFHAWANLSARLLHLEQEERLEILNELDIAPEDWACCDEHYCLALTADIAAQRMDRAEHYGQACAAELERRKKAASERPVQPEVELTPEAEAIPVETARTPVPAAPMPPFLYTEAPSAPEAFAGPAVACEIADLTSTAVGLEKSAFMMAGSSLPFVDKPSAEFVAQMSAPTHPSEPSDPMGGTISLPADLIAQARELFPFAKQSVGETAGNSSANNVALPQMPLQTYASLCAELSVSPERAPNILTKYNIAGRAAQTVLDQDWQARFAAHPETYREWHKLFTEYREWLLKQPRWRNA